MTTDMYVIFWLPGFSHKKRSQEKSVKNADQLCLSQAKLPKIKANRSFLKCNICWSAHPISLSMYPKDDDTRRNGMENERHKYIVLKASRGQGHCQVKSFRETLSYLSVVLKENYRE